MSDRHQILNNQDFWTRLEFVAGRWLETSDARNFRRFWSDGFLPETAKDTRFGVDVEGMAWVGAARWALWSGEWPGASSARS